VNGVCYYSVMEMFLMVYVVITLLFLFGLTVCAFFLDYFPTSNITNFIRRYIIDQMDDHI